MQSKTLIKLNIFGPEKVEINFDVEAKKAGSTLKTQIIYYFELEDNDHFI
jgi:hypothetical protein